MGLSLREENNQQVLSDEFLLKHAQSKFRQSRNWRDENIQNRWMKDNNLYNGVFERKEKQKSDVLLGQGRLFIPKIYTHTQRVFIDILDSIFFDPEEIVDIGSSKGIPTELKQTVKALLNYRLNEHPINFYAEAFEAALDALKNKVGIFKIYPELEYEDAVDEATGQPYKNVVAYHPRIECRPYEDIFFDARATWKDYYKYTIIDRMTKSMDYLKRRGYKNLDQINFATSYNTDEIKQQRASEQGQSLFTGNETYKPDKEVTIYEIWTFLDVNGDGFLESCSYILAGEETEPKIVISDVQENILPYKIDGDYYNRPPYTVGQALPEPHQMYGKSYPEINEGLQKETNALRNQRREAVALALRKPLLVNRGSNIDTTSLMNRKIGQIVMGDDISEQSVRELQFSDPTATSIQEQAQVDKDFYETSSIPPNLLGMPSSPDETATGVTSHVQNAIKKIQFVISNLRYTLFIPSFQMLLRLEQQYESDAFIMMVTGKTLGWQKPDDGIPAIETIQGDFDLTCNMGTNKQNQINKYMLLIDRVNMANQTMFQMVTGGVVQLVIPNPNAFIQTPDGQIIPTGEPPMIPNPQVHFMDIMKLTHRIMNIMGEKNEDEYMIQAVPPPMPQQPKGIASQTKMTGDNNAKVTSMNPEGMM